MKYDIVENNIKIGNKIMYGVDKDILDIIHSLEKENQELKKQQKEFIEYLENCINELKKESMNKLQNTINLGIVDITKEILSKYKSIIGGKE